MQKKTFIAGLAGVFLTAAALAGCHTSDRQTAAPETTAAESTGAVTPESTDAAGGTTASGAGRVNRTQVHLGALKGPTSLGLLELLAEDEEGNTINDYSFDMAGGADQLMAPFIRGELDIAAVPANMAAILYQKTEENTEFIAVNTLGVLYLVQSGQQTIHSWSDLKGQTIMATGQGASPEYVLRYLLTSNGLDPDQDVTIDWKAEPTEAVAAMKKAGGIAVLPQPFVTAAKGQLQDLHTVMDLTAEWDKLGNGSRLITAGFIVNRQFAEENPEAVEGFLEDYAKSAAWVNANPADAAPLAERFDIVKAAVAEKAIPDCHIVSLTGNDMIAAVSGYLKVLYDLDPASVGGSLPGDDFYYTGAEE